MQEYNWPLMKDTLNWSDRLKLATFVLTANRFTQGDKVREFEHAWSDWLGVKHSVFVTSGSTANLLLLDAVKEMYFKDTRKIKVLVPACTWVTNVNPVFQLGMTPVFCDVNLNNFSFDLEHAKQISQQHEIDIVFTSHLLGLPAPSASIRELFPDAVHLDDVCESHGAIYPNLISVGALNEGSTFSFYYGHHMSTIEGGMVCTNSDTLNNLLRMKRSHGMSRASVNPAFYNKTYPDIDSQFLFVRAGYNFRNTELAAVLGLSQLKRLDKFIDIRHSNYLRFIEMLEDMDQFYVPDFIGNSSFCFPLIAKTPLIKDCLIRRLKLNGIEYRPVVGGNLLRQPYLKKYAKGKFPNADIIHENGIYIGNNQHVGNKELTLLENILKDLP